MIDINESMGRVVLLEDSNFLVSPCAVSGLLPAVSFVPHLIGLSRLEMLYRPRLPIKTALPILEQTL